MTLTQLEYIVAVYNHKNFSVAANHCFVTQPTLSMQIQKLEEELGVQIFDRSNNPVKVTEIGEKIVKQGSIILNEKERIISLIDSVKGEFTGSLRIGIIPTLAPFLLPIFLESFIKKYPKIELIFDEITTAEIVKGLNKNFYDVGILALPINESGIVEETIFFEPFVGYIHNSHKLFKKDKIKLEDISTDDLLLLKEGHCLREQTLKVCSSSEREWNEKSNRILFESGNLDTLIKLVEKKFGITLLPFLAEQYLSKEQALMIREFSDPVPKREVGLIYNKSLVKKHLVKVLMEEISASIPELLKRDKEGIIIH